VQVCATQGNGKCCDMWTGNIQVMYCPAVNDTAADDFYVYKLIHSVFCDSAYCAVARSDVPPPTELLTTGIFYLSLFFFNYISDINTTKSLLTPIRDAGVWRSSTSVRVRVCLFVCLHDRTKTAETKLTKLTTGIVNNASWLSI